MMGMRSGCVCGGGAAAAAAVLVIVVMMMMLPLLLLPIPLTNPQVAFISTLHGG